MNYKKQYEKVSIDTKSKYGNDYSVNQEYEKRCR